MIAVEYIVPAVLVGCFALLMIFRRSTVWALIYVASISQILILSFRVQDYNSDTYNYSRYIDLLSESDGLEILFASKFEPLHLVMAFIASDFESWLLIEGVVCAILVAFLIRRLKRLETVAVVLGAALPLFSSSMRFAVGLFAVACTITLLHKIRARFITVSMVGLASHVSLLMTGLLLRRSVWPVVLLVVGFVAYSSTDISIVERAGGGDDNTAGGTGLRPLVALFIMLLIYKFRRDGYSSASFGMDAVIALVIFSTAVLFYPVFNRFIVILLVARAIQLDGLPDRKRVRGSGAEVGGALMIYGVLVVPHLLSLSRHLIAGDW